MSRTERGEVTAVPASASPARQASRAQWALTGLIRGYRFFLSPWLGSACRFEPTCSVYALGALQQHGAAQGSYLAARRILRCHPWCAGGHDPVPSDPSPSLFTKKISS